MTFPIAATPDYVSHVEARDHTAVVASLRPFFEARTVAVVGASPRRGTIGGELFRNIIEGEFAGSAYPVNRNGEPVAGVRGTRSISEIPDPVDLAIVCVPAAAVLDAGAVRSGRRRQGRLRDLGRVRGDRLRRGERQRALARARSARMGLGSWARTASDLLGCGSAERDVRLPLSATGQHRLLVPEWRAGACLARSVRVARPGALGVRLDRQQGGRLLERSARVVGGRPHDRGRAALPRVVRQPDGGSQRLLAGSPARSRSSPSRAARRVPVHARRARTPRRLPARRPRSTRFSARRG